MAGGVPAGGRFGAAKIATAAPDAEAGAAEGGDGRDPAPQCGASEVGKRKIHPLLLRFCERRGLRCPAVINHYRPTGRKRRGTARGSVTPEQPGPAQAPAPPPPEAAQVKGAPGAAFRVGPGDGHRGRGARPGAASLVRLLDLRSRFGLAVATPGMSSRWARDFADLAFDRFPGPADRVLSHNGSE